MHYLRNCWRMRESPHQCHRFDGGITRGLGTNVGDSAAPANPINIIMVRHNSCGSCCGVPLLNMNTLATGHVVNRRY